MYIVTFSPPATKACKDPGTPQPGGVMKASTFLPKGRVTFSCKTKGFVPKVAASKCSGTSWSPATTDNKCEGEKSSNFAYISGFIEVINKVKLFLYIDDNLP